MKETGIFFTDDHIRKIRGGTKSETRRLMKPQPKHIGFIDGENNIPAWLWRNPKLNAGYCHTDREAMIRLAVPLCPYGAVGDRLYIREWYSAGGEGAVYRAEGDLPLKNDWTAAMFMPRKLARTFLEITSIDIERLQEITEEAAVREGCVATTDYSAADHYCDVWSEINGKKNSDQWEANPWVWVVGFQLVG